MPHRGHYGHKCFVRSLVHEILGLYDVPMEALGYMEMKEPVRTALQLLLCHEILTSL